MLAFFASSDGIVNENLVANFYNEIEIAEVRQFYSIQMLIEAIHCVAPNTRILTDKGYFEIKKLEEKEVNVWNGNEFSKVIVKKTSDCSKLYKVILSNGMELECTEEHKWHIRQGNQNHPESCKNVVKFTKDLSPNDVIITNWSYPNLNIETNDEFLNPYTHGFFCGDGSHLNGYPVIYLYGDKIKLLEHLEVSSNKEGKFQNSTPQKRINCYLTNKINKDKYFVPINYNTETKLRWLEGYLDADGTSNLNPKKTSQSLQIASINKKFLQDVQLMLSTIGIDTNIKLNHKQEYRNLPTHKDGIYKDYLCKECYVLYISCFNTKELYNMGLRPKRVILHTIDQNIKQNKSLVKIINVIDENKLDETYCFNEPKNHTGIFNGILTGQSEQYSLLIDTYISDTTEKNNLFKAIETIPAIKKKAEWAIKWIEEGNAIKNIIPKEFLDSLQKLQNEVQNAEYKDALNYLTKERPNLAQRLLAFICVEGIFFSGSFCAIYWLKARGLLPGLATANQFIARDENLHVEFAIELFKTLNLNAQISKEKVEQIVREAVVIEKEFISESLPVSLIGMNCVLMKEYIEYVADRWLVLLGYEKIYNASNPFSFMELISVNDKTNFFESNVSSYQKASVGTKEEQRVFTLEDDF